MTIEIEDVKESLGMEITLIAAFDDNRVIGNEGEIPWHIPEDMKHFRETTLYYPVIIGRKTAENICPLPKRTNIVLSRSKNFHDQYTVTARNIIASLHAASDTNKDQVFVAGGESIYEQFLPHADSMIISKVDGEYEGDRFFPPVDLNKWDIEWQSIRNNFTIIKYVRSR